MLLPRLTSMAILLVIASGLALAACSGSLPSLSSGEGGVTGSISKADPSASSRAGQSVDKIFSVGAQGTSKFTVAAPEDYRISPSDVLEISVFGVADLTRTVQVSTNGAISLPLIRTVPAAGKRPPNLNISLPPSWKPIICNRRKFPCS